LSLRWGLAVIGAMSTRVYKTNGLLWLALSLLLFVAYFCGVDYTLALFSGRVSGADLGSFEFLYSVFASVAAGWLLQCAAVIVFSWRHGKAKQ
jgi:hypothetical protein